MGKCLTLPIAINGRGDCLAILFRIFLCAGEVSTGQALGGKWS